MERRSDVEKFELTQYIYIRSRNTEHILHIPCACCMPINLISLDFDLLIIFGVGRVAQSV